MKGLAVLAAVAALVSVVIGRFFFTVFPWQHALILQFGEVISTKSTPGFFLKLPWQDVLYMESRILTIDGEDPDLFITSEKENVLVDSYVKWRIKDPLTYYISVGADEQRAELRLIQVINRSLRDEIGKHTVEDVVSGERSKIMEVLRSRSTKTAGEIGIEILDVRVKRVELPQEISENVYRNMIAERRRVANKRRATGDAEKEKIRANADKKRTKILAEAYRKSEIIRGEGDAKSAGIYAKAYSAHTDFYAFYLSLNAYRRSFGSSSDFFVLDPDSDFLRFFKYQQGHSESIAAGGKTKQAQ